MLDKRKGSEPLAEDFEFNDADMTAIVVDENKFLEPILDEDDDVEDLDVLVFVYEILDVADHCRLELFEDNVGPFDVFDLCDFNSNSADEPDVNHFVVEFCNIDVFDGNEEDPFDVECLDVPFSLAELDDFRIDGPHLLGEFVLDHLDADCTNLLNLNSRFLTELLKSIFAFGFLRFCLTLLMSLLMIMNLAMFRTGMMLLNSSS